MAQLIATEQRPRWPGRAWWLGSLAILGLAGALRFTGSQFSLPYVDHLDEPAFYLTAMEWRGVFSIGNYIPGYPPLYIWLHELAQVLLGPLGIDSLAEGIGLFRLLSAAFSLATLVLIALTAWRIMGEWAGWVGAVAWALAPLVVQYDVLATPDPLLYMLVALALWLAVESLFGRPWWAVWSVAAGCLAILDKYYVLSAALPGLIVALLIAQRDRRLGLKILAAQAVLLALTAVIAVAGIAVLPREAATARNSGLANFLDPARALNNLYYAALPLAPLALTAYALIGGLAWWIARRQNATRALLTPLALVAATTFTIPWLASTFSVVGETGRMKDVLPATVGLCILLGVAVGQIIALYPIWRRAVWALVVLAPLIVLVWLPQLGASAAITQERLLPDSRVALREWADAAIEPGTVLVQRVHHKTFNPYWGGISHRHWFDWWEIPSPLEQTVEDWRSAYGISYAAIELNVWERMATTEAGRIWRDAVLPLRTFDSEAMRGPDTIFVRLWRPEVETDAQFGDTIRLVGYDLSAETAAPGGEVTLRFYWNAIAPPAANYSLFVHLVPAGSDGQPAAQSDGAPASPGRPTLLWTDASETLISDLFTLALPAELAPGAYEIRIGLYDYATGARLPVTADDALSTGDALRLTTLTVLTAP